MRRISSKGAARRMAAVLDAADTAPVVIERRGKPRAVVVSARRFDLYETVLRALTD
ncbi:MAG: type II toxin-antitoxin system prevent-host-death family antitoxin [Parvularculaceae bacterium]|nr:type II toxin-antitoxin system prevent-host-death family antitoxin [Parvularculaceae bacterium]